MQALLRRPLHRLPVYGYQAEPHGVSLLPLEVVEKAPAGIADDGNPLALCLHDTGNGGRKESAARFIVVCCNAVLGDKEIPRERFMDAAEHMVQTFRIVLIPHLGQRSTLGIRELAVRSEEFERAGEIKKRQEKKQAKIDKVREKWEKDKRSRKLIVSESDIADVVSAWTKIPVQKLTEEENERLRKLESVLHERVVGQEEAVGAVARAIRRGRVGLKDPHRPIGSFLFLGPTGVGKTELCKALAEAMFGTEQALIRVDMSEYMEKHSVSKMVGSPPGYVGYDEGGQLSEKVRRNPYSVILFDEIEKAHPDVFNILLQVLDDGHITDSQGRKIDFKNTIIIMTSNAGAQRIVAPKVLGFAARENAETDYRHMKDGVMDEVRRLFKPEFLNRIDETIVFHQLTRENMKEIVDILLRGIEKRTESQMGLKIVVSPEAKEFLIDRGYDPKYGARPLKRTIQTELEDRLAEALLEGTVKERSEILVTCPEAGQESERRLVFTETEASEKPKKRRKPVKAAET